MLTLLNIFNSRLIIPSQQSNLRGAIRTKSGSPWLFAVTETIPTSSPFGSSKNTKIPIASKTLTLAAWATLIEAMQRLG